MSKTIAFTDGASRGNPGPGGWGAVVLSGNSVSEFGGAEKKTTNNRMELGAAIFVIKKFAPLTLVTDSSYVLNGATKWIHSWKENDWKTKQKTDVLNKDLWKELDKVMKDKEVDWKLVSGHSTVPGNNRADKIATAFADGKGIDLFSGSIREYGINDLWGDGVEAPSSRRKGKAYSYISKVDGKIEVHKTWADCENRVKGKRARFKKALSPEEEKEIVKDFRK